MKVYELMALLGEAKANDDVKVDFVMLTEKLKQFPEIGENTYCVTLDVYDVLTDEAVLEARYET